MEFAVLPSEAPFRVNQVMAAPAPMAILYSLQLMLAGLLTWSGARRAWRWWWTAAAALVAITALFFALGSWGTTDVTKLSHWMKDSPGMATQGEPFWHLVAPLIEHLPYRMAAVHGMVAAAYGLAALLLARHWQVPAWGGWWCLFLTTHPILRGFLQNGQTRQALAALLLLPLMLRAARLVRLPWGLVGGSTAWSALCHTTFPVNLVFAMLPALVSGPGGSLGWRQAARRWPILVLPVLAVAALIGPVAVEKLNTYAHEIRFFSHYAVRREVLLQEGAMLLAVLVTCFRRRLGPRDLLSCPRSRVLAVFMLLFASLQASVVWQWWPQITFRLADVAGLFLLVSVLAWLHHYRAEHFLLPALALTLHYWLADRILASGQFACGQDDQFLCIPDRLPSQVRY
jgi:hypothetical protein